MNFCHPHRITVASKVVEAILSAAFLGKATTLLSASKEARNGSWPPLFLTQQTRVNMSETM
jgi:hypothetical protein